MLNNDPICLSCHRSCTKCSGVAENECTECPNPTTAHRATVPDSSF
jgi:hypothetical protein